MRRVSPVRRVLGSTAAGTLVAVAVAAAVVVGPRDDVGATSHVALGSRALAREIHATGLGSAHPRTFDVGQFPIFQRLRWGRWGTATATGLGVNVPDGGPGIPRAQILAYSLGRCDGQTVYRRIRARVQRNGHWGPWDTLSPTGATAAHQGLFCLRAVAG